MNRGTVAGELDFPREEARAEKGGFRRSGPRRVASFGLIVGGAVTSLPWLASQLNRDDFWPVNLFLAPGMVVCLVMSAGNVHDYSLAVVLIANIFLYAVATFLALKMLGK